MKTTFLGAVQAELNKHTSPELPLIAEKSGVPESTVRKLRYGDVTNPRVNTVQALHDYFAKRPGKPERKAA